MLNEKNLRGYQKKCIDHIINNPYSGLFLDMGLGKTISTLTAINELKYNRLEVNTVLVISTKRVVESVWGQEVEKWDHVKHLTFSLISGNPEQRKKAIRKKADVYLVSRDNTDWLVSQLKGNQFDMLVVDESTSFKNPGSKRFKALRKMFFKRVVILTGTPAPKSYMDLWSQMYLLDKGKRLGKTLTSYRQKYFDPGLKQGYVVFNWSLKPGAKEQIDTEIKDICMSLEAKDHLDMPELIINRVPVRLSDSELKKYKRFEKDKILEISGETLTGANAGAMFTKLKQAANGTIYNEDGGVSELHRAKIETLSEILETSDQNFLLAWEFRHDRDRIINEVLKPLKVNYRQLQNDKDVKEWNQGKIKVLLTHPASGGHGLNLQAGGCNIIWYGQPVDLELFLQLNARLYRQGQTSKHVIIQILTAVNTIENRISNMRNSKNKLQSELIKAVKQLVSREK